MNISWDYLPLRGLKGPREPSIKYAKFSEKLLFLSFEGVRNVSFWVNFAHVLNGWPQAWNEVRGKVNHYWDPTWKTWTDIKKYTPCM